MTLTLEQVAKLAGVSRTTVSRVINGQPSVRSEVRKRVWQVIRDHDYQPDQAARTLVTRRTNVIGLLVPEALTRLFTDPFFSQLMRGIAEVCNQRGYDLRLALMTMTTERDKFYRRLLYTSQLDGVIVASPPLNDPMRPHVQAGHRPCVLVGRHPDYADLPWVDVDNVAGAKAVVEHLISLGHRRIATITGPLEMVAGQDRLEGYRLAMARAGIGYDEALVAEGDFTQDSGFYAMQRLLRAEPTAAFVGNDLMAAGAIQALTQAGRRVPDDVSIAGYDDAPIATLANPQLTTVQQSVIDLGKIAAEKLIGLLENPEVMVSPQILSTRLIVRQSTRAVACP